MEQQNNSIHWTFNELQCIGTNSVPAKEGLLKLSRHEDPQIARKAELILERLDNANAETAPSP